MRPFLRIRRLGVRVPPSAPRGLHVRGDLVHVWALVIFAARSGILPVFLIVGGLVSLRVSAGCVAGLWGGGSGSSCLDWRAAGVCAGRAGVYGGPVAVVSAVRVLRRRRRVFGGRPWAARRSLSSCLAFQACRIRWLRTISRAVVNSMRGARLIRRHQPRLMSLVAGSLAVAKPRSAPVRRA